MEALIAEYLAIWDSDIVSRVCNGLNSRTNVDDRVSKQQRNGKLPNLVTLVSFTRSLT